MSSVVREVMVHIQWQAVYRTNNYPEGRDGTKLHKSISQAAAYHQRLLHQNHDTFIVISSINILRSQTVPIH